MRGLLFACIVYTCITNVVEAHQQGSDPDAEWFGNLRAPNGTSCCNLQDCYRVTDDSLEIKNGHYRIRYKHEWLTVPEEVILRDVPNPTAFPVACVHETMKGRDILCFVPASQA